jgi:hypothetical protein
MLLYNRNQTYISKLISQQVSSKGIESAIKMICGKQIFWMVGLNQSYTIPD